MSKIVVALACTLPLILVGCGGGSSPATLLTSPSDPVSNPVGSSSSSSSPTSQTISFTVPALALGSTLQLQATASSGLPVTYASQTPSTCTVSGSTVTGVLLGSCTLTANQAGNASYTAAPQVQIIIPVLKSQTVSGFTIPTLTVSGRVVINPTATSSLPVLITTLTPATCSVKNNITISGVTTGTCTLQASQAGSDQYAAAPSLSISATIIPSNTTLAQNAVLAPWIATPQAGSTTADSTTTLEGIYQNNSSGIALIDSSNNFYYFDYYGELIGSLTQNASDWTLNSSATHYPALTTAITANGTFSTKNTFTGIAQSFTTVTPLLNLNYSTDNGFAALPSSPAGSWLYNDAYTQFNISISNTGIISGTEMDIAGGICTLTGSVVQKEPTSQHNMYSLTLNASSVSGSFCNLDTTGTYTGLMAMSFVPAGANDSNGYLPTLTLMAQDPVSKSPLALTVFQP